VVQYYIGSFSYFLELWIDIVELLLYEYINIYIVMLMIGIAVGCWNGASGWLDGVMHILLLSNVYYIMLSND